MNRKEQEPLPPLFLANSYGKHRLNSRLQYQVALGFSRALDINDSQVALPTIETYRLVVHERNPRCRILLFISEIRIHPRHALWVSHLEHAKTREILSLAILLWMGLLYIILSRSCFEASVLTATAIFIHELQDQTNCNGVSHWAKLCRNDGTWMKSTLGTCITVAIETRVLFSFSFLSHASYLLLLTACYVFKIINRVKSCSWSLVTWKVIPYKLEHLLQLLVKSSWCGCWLGRPQI